MTRYLFLFTYYNLVIPSSVFPSGSLTWYRLVEKSIKNVMINNTMLKCRKNVFLLVRLLLQGCQNSSENLMAGLSNEMFNCYGR